MPDARKRGAPPHTPRNRTREALELAGCLTSFPRFCALLQIPDQVSGKRIPLRLTGIQRAYNVARTGRDIILKPRKVYFTTLEMARDLWWFLTKPGARVIIVCQTEDDHGMRDTLADMLRVMLESLREWVPVQLDVENQYRLAWHANDATLRIVEAGATVDTARKRGRGIAVNRLHATEVAFWNHAEETLTVLLNAMPQDGSGEAVFESTPNGAAGYYFERWGSAVKREGNFIAQFFPWYHHELYRERLAPGEFIVPRDDEERRLTGLGVTAEALKWRRMQIADKGHDKTAQEYPGDPNTCFLLSGREYFDSRTTTTLLANAKPPVQTVPIRDSGAFADLRIYGLPERGAEYVVAADTSEGSGGDESAAVVREVGTGLHMATLSGQVKPGELGLVLARLARTFNHALLVVERAGPGLTTLDRLLTAVHYPRVFFDRDGKPGYSTNSQSRPAALAGLEQGQREGTWRTQDELTLRQMRVFVWREMASGNVRAEADAGEKDDLIMAEAICWDVLRRPVLRVVRDLDVFEG